MHYKISVRQIDENNTTKNQEIILHEDPDTVAVETDGRLITKDAYVKFVSHFANKNLEDPGNTEIDNEIVAVRFNRHVLQLLLALPGCESLVLVKAKNDRKDTITIIAAGKDDMPLGWDPSDKPGDPEKFDAEKFAASEWGRGITRREARGMLINAITEGVDFKKFFNEL